METIAASLYDFPKYYDALFGSDWRAELRFLEGCFRRFSSRPVRRVFEPACGTGRLLFRFAKAGYEVAGNDLNPKAVDYCNRRLSRHGFPPTARLEDMAQFRLPRKIDAAFNTINSFRHLPDEAAAAGHLRCVADALRAGGLYVLGLHLTPTRGDPDDEESWSARRGHLAVLSHMWSIQVDRRRRRERVGMVVDVYTPSRRFRLAEEIPFRTYTAGQMDSLLDRVGRFEVVDTFDFTYDLDHPTPVDAWTQDVIYVLRKTS
ncbi:MAG: SAM-dependent methyltransferase [Pirellulales bacterium]